MIKNLIILILLFLVIFISIIIFYTIVKNCWNNGWIIGGLEINQMYKKYKKSIFIFRRDFRLVDNIGLIECSKNSEKVIPIFIFTPEQITDKNKYKSENAIRFMIESLEELDKINYFYGEPSEIIEKIIKYDKDVESVYVNMDYTPYSKLRDKKIEKVCKKYGVGFKSYEDILLHPVNSILTSSNKVYTKFTPYLNVVKKVKVEKPKNYKIKNLMKVNYPFLYKKNKDKRRTLSAFNILYGDANPDLIGGRSNGLKILKDIKIFKNYNNKRDSLEYETTRLSAYIKFGCISIREVYWKFKEVLGSANDLIKQLIWRDFYYNVVYNYGFKSGKEKMDKIKWINNRSWLKKWEEGKTGFPIIDAGMRQLNSTGYMHNRSRLLTSNFLVKLLINDWRAGEKYYARMLTDYDPSVNNGNWQWTSSFGITSQDYFVVFNPWSQGKKHDKDCKYIKEWIPELKEVENNHIHNWYKYYKEYDVDYPSPIIDYSDMKENYLSRVRKIYK